MTEEHESHIEHINHAVEEHVHENQRVEWIRWGALMAAIFAVIAAFASMRSSYYADESMVELIESTDQWEYYQAKSLKALILQTQNEILTQLGKPAPAKSASAYSKYKEEQADIALQARTKEQQSKYYRNLHSVFSQAVTFLQIAIAMVAIAMVTKRKHYLLFAGLLAGIAIFFLLYGFMV